jgi:hypothetical protein
MKPEKEKRARCCLFHPSSFILHPCRSIVARHRFDGADYLFVWNLLGGADETGVTTIEQQYSTMFRVASQSGDELLALQFIQGTEVHESDPPGRQELEEPGFEWIVDPS